MIDPSSGNVSLPKRAVRRSAYPNKKEQVTITVKTRKKDGMIQPAVVVWEDGKAYLIDRVYGCRHDPATGDMQYTVRIGHKSTSIWRRQDGSYYAIRRK